MPGETDTSIRETSANLAVHRRFRLTIAFVFGSVMLMIAAVFATDVIGRNIGESTTVRLQTAEAESKARITGDTLGRLLSNARLNASGHADDSEMLHELSHTFGDPTVNLRALVGDDAVDALFKSLDFHHMGFETADGTQMWSVGSQQGLSHDPAGLALAASGETVSWLNREMEISDATGGTVKADLLESLVPFGTSAEGSERMVFHYVVDITEELNSNISAIQSEIRNKVLLMLGVLLGVLSLLVLGLDFRITRQNRAVLARERKTREVLGARYSNLRRVDEAKNEFLSSLSHELKTPLAAILGFARILSSNRPNNLEERQMEQLEIINRNGLRLDVLINDLLDLSRIQSGRIKVIPEETDMSKLVWSVAESFETIVSSEQQILVAIVEHEAAWIDVDSTRIAQVLSNLISNASKYSPQGSKITLNSVNEGDSIVITVSDEGPGMSEEDQKQLFTLFYRTPGALGSSVPGTGIGLYVSKQIVELHGGEISLESTPGRGTSVTVRLFGAKSEPSDAAGLDKRFWNTLRELDEAV